MILKKPPIEIPVLQKNGILSLPWVEFYNELYRRLGNVDAGNYSEFGVGGELSFSGTARIDWTKITADTVTLNAGTSASTVADLQTAMDGNYYHIDESAATPAIELIVDFVSVKAFNWVQVIGVYQGSDAHGIGIQLYNWSTTAWDTFCSFQNNYGDLTTANGKILDDHSFFVADDTNYIGTGANDGDVRWRCCHTPSGNTSHDLDIDVVALYQ